MELCPTGSLQKLISHARVQINSSSHPDKEHLVIGSKEIMHYAAQISGFLHQQRIIHRDLKPEKYDTSFDCFCLNQIKHSAPPSTARYEALSMYITKKSTLHVW